MGLITQQVARGTVVLRPVAVPSFALSVTMLNQCKADVDWKLDPQQGLLVGSSSRRLRLSPSAISTFKQCPLLFRLRYIERLPEPLTEELASGVLVHEALEQLFDRPAAERELQTAQVLSAVEWPQRMHGRAHAIGFATGAPLFCGVRCIAQVLFREAWKTARKQERYMALFEKDGERDTAREREWGLRSFKRLATYFALEDPSQIEPLAREERVSLKLADGPEVTGVIDRLDGSDSAGSDGSHGDLIITDYKTGSSPKQKYNAETNERIRRDAFKQLHIYALLMQLSGRPARQLRLLYLKDGVELKQTVTPGALAEVDEDVRDVWSQLIGALQEAYFPTKPGPLCGWCAHKSSCPAHNDE